MRSRSLVSMSERRRKKQGEKHHGSGSGSLALPEEVVQRRARELQGEGGGLSIAERSAMPGGGNPMRTMVQGSGNRYKYLVAEALQMTAYPTRTLERMRQAEDKLREAIELCPERRDAHGILAQLLVVRDSDEAVSHYLRTVELSVNHDELWAKAAVSVFEHFQANRHESSGFTLPAWWNDEALKNTAVDAKSLLPDYEWRAVRMHAIVLSAPVYPWRTWDAGPRSAEELCSAADSYQRIVKMVLAHALTMTISLPNHEPVPKHDCNASPAAHYQHDRARGRTRHRPHLRSHPRPRPHAHVDCHGLAGRARAQGHVPRRNWAGGHIAPAHLRRRHEVLYLACVAVPPARDRAGRNRQRTSTAFSRKRRGWPRASGWRSCESNYQRWAGGCGGRRTSRRDGPHRLGCGRADKFERHRLKGRELLRTEAVSNRHVCCTQLARRQLRAVLLVPVLRSHGGAERHVEAWPLASSMARFRCVDSLQCGVDGVGPSSDLVERYTYSMYFVPSTVEVPCW